MGISPDGAHHATALDFATSTGHGPSPRESEIAATLTELRDHFSEEDIIEGMATIGWKAPVSTREAVLQALRAYSVLIMESDNAKLTAKLVGKLCKLDVGCGRNICLRELGNEAGLSKQAVSKRQARYADRLGIPRPDSTEEARESHRLMNKRNFNGAGFAMVAT